MKLGRLHLTSLSFCANNSTICNLCKNIFQKQKTENRNMYKESTKLLVQLTAALSPLIFTQLIDKLARPIPQPHLIGPSRIAHKSAPSPSPSPDPDPHSDTVWELIA